MFPSMNDELLTELAGLLIQRGEMLSTAESCTGGGIAHVVTELAGSSAWFDAGFVTYSNSAKQRMLHVSVPTLERFGAVSDAVVREMALGAVQQSQADWSISVSGIAGPDGGTEEKPVGTVWAAWAHRDKVLLSHCYQFEGTRAQVRQQTIDFSLTELLRLVQSN